MSFYKFKYRLGWFWWARVFHIHVVLLRAPGKMGFSVAILFLHKTYVVGAHLNRLGETILISHNVCSVQKTTKQMTVENLS